MQYHQNKYQLFPVTSDLQHIANERQVAWWLASESVNDATPVIIHLQYNQIKGQIIQLNDPNKPHAMQMSFFHSLCKIFLSLF